MQQLKRWTKEEENFFKENYPQKSILEIANIIGRSRDSVKKFAQRHNLHNENYKFWTDDETKFLLENFQLLEYKQIAKVLGKDESAIKTKLSKLGRKKDRKKKPVIEKEDTVNHWLEPDDKMLIENYVRLDNKQLADLLGRTETSISKRLWRLGLVRSKHEDYVSRPHHFGEYENWTAEEDELLHQNIANLTYGKLGELIGRTEAAVTIRASRLGVAREIQWTKEQENYVQENYSTLAVSEIALTLGRSETAIYCRLSKLGCLKNMSAGHNEVLVFIKSLLSTNILINDRKTLQPQELDIYLPEKLLAFEYNGLYWHSENRIDHKYHFGKTKACREKNIQLLHIFEDDWKNKKEIVQSIIKNKLGLNGRKIFARKTQIKQIDSKVAKEFQEANHLSGYVQSKTNFGLFYCDELVACLGLREPFHKKYKDFLEISRFSVKTDTTVIGGLSKLLSTAKNYCKENGFKGIITYVDNCIGSGSSYEKVGFEFVEENKVNYWYTDFKQRYNRFQFRAQDGMSEKEYAKSKGMTKIYGPGNKLFKMEF